MKYEITHRTLYSYAEPVDLADHLLYLTPRELPYQRVLEARIQSDPLPSRRRDRLDHFGNQVVQLSIEEPHPEFSVTALCTVEVSAQPPPADELTPPWELVRDILDGDGFPDLFNGAVSAAEFTHPSPLVPLLAEARDYALPSFPPGQRLMACLRDLTSRIHRDFSYKPGATAVSTPTADVLRSRRGVCQDFAHVQIACLRSLGLAARYVSGYLRTLPPPGEKKRVGADASHAWVSVWCPGGGEGASVAAGLPSWQDAAWPEAAWPEGAWPAAGWPGGRWVDLDPTNDLLVADEHVVLAWGRDFADVSPVRGVILGGGPHSLDVAVNMEELS